MHLDNLLILAKLQFKLPDDSIHGVNHWLQVLKHGLNIIKTNGGDEIVVLLFALFHDCCRINEESDPDHGFRALEYINKLEFNITDEQKELLYFAISNHNMNIISTDPTIGACWDADRLDLVRVGEVLSIDYFSTFEAKQIILNTRIK